MSNRENILQVGTRLIVECGGLEGVNTNSIARAAGVGVGTFYRHFEDKYALLRAAASGGLETLQADLTRADQATAGGSLLDQVRANVSAFVGFAARDPDRFRIIFLVASSGGNRSRASVGFSPRALERRLQTLQAEGQLEERVDPAVAARAFSAAEAQAVLWWIQEAPTSDPAPLIETLVRLHPALACRP